MKGLSKRRLCLWVAAFVVLLAVALQLFSGPSMPSAAIAFSSSVLWNSTMNNNPTTIHPTPSHSHRRMLLAIFSTRTKESDMQLRFLIQSTYLRFYHNLWPHLSPAHNNTPRYTICSWGEALHPSRNNLCQIVFTFVVYGPATNRGADNTTMPVSKQADTVTQLNPHWKHPSLPPTWSLHDDKTRPTALKKLQFYQYLSTLDSASAFDWIVTTDVRVLIHPHLFFPQVFHSKPDNDTIWQDNHGRIHVVPTMRIHQVLSELANASSAETILQQQQIELQLPHTNLLSNASYFVLPDTKRGQHLDRLYLQHWQDDYQDVIVQYPPYRLPSSAQRGPKLLVGIFSVHDSELERKRRDLIRKTYLRYTATTTGEPAFCRLPQYYLQTSNLETFSSCRVLYTFVVGRTCRSGMHEYPTTLVPAYLQGNVTWSNLTVPIVPTTPTGTALEQEFELHQDLTLVNICENMNQGKTPTWFLFASHLQKQAAAEAAATTHPIVIDYIAKMDSDTLLYPDVLVEHVLPQLPPAPHNTGIYGGASPIVKAHPEQSGGGLAGPYYFQGAFYLLSWDVATFVSTQWQTVGGTEDKSLGNAVWGYYDYSPIRSVTKISMGGEWFAHPVKEPYRFRNLWNKKYPALQVEL